MALHAKVKPGQLTLSYPNGTSDSIFTFAVGTFAKKRTISGWKDVQGLDVKVSGNINKTYDLSFAGGYGGSSSTIRDFEFWNFTYTLPDGLEEVPKIVLDVALKY